MALLSCAKRGLPLSITEVITYKYVLEALDISVHIIQIEAKQTYKGKIQITP